MTTPLRISSRFRWIGLVLLVLALGGLLFWPRPHTRRKIQVLILSAEVKDGGRDVGPGLETLFSDHLEVLAGATVIHARALPANAELERLPPDMHLFRFQARREGDQLALTPAWSTPAQVLAGAPWSIDSLPPREPRATLAAWIRRWPLPGRMPAGRGDLLPQSPARFWSLVQAMSIRGDEEATAHLKASQDLADAEPLCATAWATLGDHLYRSLWVNPEHAGVGLNSRTHKAFQRAVDLSPGHPRATFLWSLMLTDTGNQSTALKALGEAVRLRPQVPDLYHGLAYAGRTSGLLAGARSALARREALLAPLSPPSAWFAETTYLYLGDWAAFERDLERTRAVRTDASLLFYQGYLALLKGDRTEARFHMKAGEESPGPGPFRDLCRVYLAFLEGRSADGLAELHRIDDIRGKLRIPDGEWTFKEAEAYALLGDADQAVDCATRAFVQGFSCARWYEASPFLERMRAHPRWPMLRRNIRERQAVLDGSFPPSTFLP